MPPIFLRATAALAFCWMLSGCFSSVVTEHADFDELQPDITDPTAAPYRIGAGDELEVKFFFAPELNDKLQVRPDGKISMMFLQDVRAAGRTPEELAAILRKKLSPHVPHPDLVVIMRGFASQKIFIGGEVLKPGAITLASRETLTQALDEAGWVATTARRNEIVLLRRGRNGKRSLYIVNMDNILTGEDLRQDVMMEPGDVIFVPPSNPTLFDRWIDQHIRQALPVPGEAVVNRGLGPQ